MKPKLLNKVKTIDASIAAINNTLEGPIDADTFKTNSVIPVSLGGTGITNLSGTDYSTARVRGIALQTTTPTEIPNGVIVGVYE